MRKFLPSLAITAASLVAAPVQAQEFNCRVSVIAPQIQSYPKRVFQSLETAMTQLMNTRRWTNMNYAPAERIDCNMLLTVNEMASINQFKGTLQVIYSRPVYGTDYLSPVLDILDNQVEFTFYENTQIEFTPERYINNLSSIVGFYAYFILGVDADTYMLNGGTDFYELAQLVVNNAQNANEAGWKAFEEQKNRYWLLDNQQQAVFRPLREFLYNYHRNGFDAMSTDLTTARATIAAALDKLKPVQQVKPSSINLQVMFNAKWDELVKLFQPSDMQEKSKVFNTLQLIDPGHIQKYQGMLKS
ncbi:MAG TPA: DUF4835 family protein [Flavobacteriales bacterium]